jgi:hypothetical protein
MVSLAQQWMLGNISVVEMHGVYDHYCRKQVEPEIGEIPVAFVAKAKGSELSEDDVKQFVAKEVIFIFLLPPFEFMHVLILNAKIKKQIHAWPFVSFFLPF